jgi:hypothetical protein
VWSNRAGKAAAVAAESDESDSSSTEKSIFLRVGGQASLYLSFRTIHQIIINVIDIRHRHTPP